MYHEKANKLKGLYLKLFQFIKESEHGSGEIKDWRVLRKEVCGSQILSSVNTVVMNIGVQTPFLHYVFRSLMVQEGSSMVGRLPQRVGDGKIELGKILKIEK